MYSNNGYNNDGYNNQGYGQGFGRGREGGLSGLNPLNLVVKGVAEGIGLASGGIHAHKEKMAAKQAAEAEEARHTPSQSPSQGIEQADYVSRPQGLRHTSEQSFHHSFEGQSDHGVPPPYGNAEEHQLRPENHRSHSS